MRLPTVSALLVALSFLLPARRRPAADPRPRRARPSVEPLEGRALPSVNLGWAFQIGGPSGDAGNSTATDSVGDVFVAGSITGSTPINFDPNPNDAPVTLNPAAGKGFLAKYSSSETLLWVIQKPQQVSCVRADATGNSYLRWSDPSSSSVCLSKFDPNGAPLWTTNLTHALPSPGYPEDFTVDGAGNVCITGGVGTPPYALTAYVAKLAGTDGHVLWQEQLSGAKSGGYSDATNWYGQGNRIATDSQGNIYLGGTYYGTVDFDPGPGTYYLSSLTLKGTGSTPDVYVLKLNASGGFVWAGSMGTDQGDSLAGIAVDGQGNVFVSGRYSVVLTMGTHVTKDDFDPGPGTYALPTSNNCFVEKLDTNGNFQWATSFGDAHLTVPGNQTAVDASGSVYVVGFTDTSVTFNPGPNPTVVTDGGFILKLDRTGAFNWAAGMVASTPGKVGPNGLAVDPVGDVYAVGRFFAPTNFNPSGTDILTPAGYDPNASTNYSDAFVLKLAQSSPQLAAGGAKTVHPNTARLTDAQLQPVVAEARRRWLAAGADPARLARLTVQVADLGGAWLGATSGTSSRIDDTAAGYGWFVDPTPADDREFTTPGDHGQRGHIDLLTVVMHEMGLGLGLSDGGPGLMQRTLPTGTRRLPTAALFGGPSHSGTDLLFALLSDAATRNRLTGHRAG